MYSKIILLAAKKAAVSGALLLAICSHESHLKNVAVMDGKTLSYGICQVKLATAQQMGFKDAPERLMIPKENAKWAAKYLKFQLKRYHGNNCKAVAAYNSGTFRESMYYPGMPRNIKYIQCVKEKMPPRLSDNITCFQVKYAEAR